jgi:hypothetical protein
LCCIAQSSLSEMHDHHVGSLLKGKQEPGLVHPSRRRLSRSEVLEA